MIGIAFLLHVESSARNDSIAIYLVVSTVVIHKLQDESNLRGGFMDLKVKVANLGSSPSQLLKELRCMCVCRKVQVKLEILSQNANFLACVVEAGACCAHFEHLEVDGVFCVWKLRHGAHSGSSFVGQTELSVCTVKQKTRRPGRFVVAYLKRLHRPNDRYVLVDDRIDWKHCCRGF